MEQIEIAQPDILQAGAMAGVKSTAVQFGSVLWIKTTCPVCGERSPIETERGGIEVFACCGRPFSRAGLKISENRVTKGKNKHRNKPSAQAQKRILDKQSDRCLYCFRRFGSLVFKHGPQINTAVSERVKLVWDHYVPYIYSLDSSDANFVAACQTCNGYKSDLMFDTLTEYQVHIAKKTRGKLFDSVEEVYGCN